MRSERSLLVLAIFDRLRGLDGVGFGVTLALAGLRLARRVLSLADDVCDSIFNTFEGSMSVNKMYE